MKLKSLIPLLSPVFLLCTEYPDINPYDPDFIGDYSFNLVKTSVPEIAYVLKEYILNYTTSKDTFLSVYPDTKLAANVDVANFWDKKNNSIRLVALKADTNKTSYNFIAETPNGKLFKDSTSLKFINPFSIKEITRPEYKEPYSCKIDINTKLKVFSVQQKKEIQNMLYDSTFTVVWNFQNSTVTIPVDSFLSFIVADSNFFSVTAVVTDKFGNHTDTLKKLVEPILVRPSVSAVDTLMHRIGSVRVPFSYSDSNDNVDSVFYQLQNSPVSAYKAYSDSKDTLSLSFPSPAVTWLDIWVTDESRLKSSKKRITIKTFIPDTVKPVIRILTPSKSIDTISSGNYLSQAAVRDNFGIKEVFYQTSVHKHPASQVNDSVWSASITDIPSMIIFAVTVSAADSFSNTATDSFFLYRDVTLTDTVPPSISQQSGPVSGSRVLTSSGTMTFKIEDGSGIDSVFFTVNGVFQDTANLTATNIYTVNYSLPKFGNNVIQVFAVDASINKNNANSQIALNYNTKPNSITNISPVDGSIGVDHTSGVNISWSGGDDVDGDPVTYVVKYGSNTTSLNTTSTQTKNVLLSGLAAEAKYYWYVDVTTSLDKIRCPAGADEYYTFTTKDLNGPQITQKTGPVDGAYVLNNVVTMTFDIADTIGLDSVYYTLNGTYIGNALHVSGDEYSITFTMSGYGSNQVTLHAIDASSEKNKSQKSISIIYYSIPTSITVISPLNNATGVENIGGISFLWHPSTDANGDPISYNIRYGAVSSSMQGVLTTDTVVAIDNFQGFTQYIWYVDVITAHDTVRCPAGDDNFYTFKTKNHDATITGFNDFSCSIKDSVSVSVTASDPETIKEYQWDFNGDGSNESVTTVSTAVYVAPSTAGTAKFILTVIDNKDNVTKDTALVTITNQNPVISAFPDTLQVYYGKPIELKAVVTDDGSNLKYEWDVGYGSFIVTSSSDTMLNGIVENLPVIKNIRFRVTDNDNNIANESTVLKVILNFSTNQSHAKEYATYHKGAFYSINVLDGGSWPRQRILTTSTDMFNWTTLVDTLRIPCIYYGMQGVSQAHIVAGESTHYIIQHLIPNENQIYKSTDMINWELVDTVTGLYRENSLDVVSDNKLICVGGYFTDGFMSYFVDRIKKINYIPANQGYVVSNIVSEDIKGIDIPLCLNFSHDRLFTIYNDYLYEVDLTNELLVSKNQIGLQIAKGDIIYSKVNELLFVTRFALYKIIIQGNSITTTKISDLNLLSDSRVSCYKNGTDLIVITLQELITITDLFN